MSGDNATSGENQQETARPRVDPMWIVGFVDGEGCFSVSVHRNPYVRQTRGMAVASHVPGLPTRAVSSGARRSDLVLRRRAHPRQGPKSSVLTYAVDSLRDLEEGILPFFEQHRLVVKAADFRLFARIVRSMRRKEHLTPAGFERAVRLAYAMNAQGKQRSRNACDGSCRILRDCTPSTVFVRDGEDTVRSSWRREEPGRNALAFRCGTWPLSEVTRMPKVAKFLVG
jgi:hypothetical protein